MALHINIFAGPGVGKSTLAMGLTAELKKRQFSADMTQEYAKELVYDENYLLLDDQLHVAGEQYRRMNRLDRCVKIAVHDSPFVMGVNYCNDRHICHLEFNNFMVSQFKRFNNLNIVLLRNPKYSFAEEGRRENLDESINLDHMIKDFLDTNKIRHYVMLNNDSIVDELIELIEKE